MTYKRMKNFPTEKEEMKKKKLNIPISFRAVGTNIKDVLMSKIKKLK